MAECLCERDPPLNAEGKPPDGDPAHRLQAWGQFAALAAERGARERHVLCGREVVIEAETLWQIAKPAAGIDGRRLPEQANLAAARR